MNYYWTPLVITKALRYVRYGNPRLPSSFTWIHSRDQQIHHGHQRFDQHLDQLSMLQYQLIFVQYRIFERCTKQKLMRYFDLNKPLEWQWIEKCKRHHLSSMEDLEMQNSFEFLVLLSRWSIRYDPSFHLPFDELHKKFRSILLSDFKDNIFGPSCISTWNFQDIFLAQNHSSYDMDHTIWFIAYGP